MAHNPFAAKLTLADAQEIRRRHAAGESQRQLAREYGVSPQAVHRVVLGQVHRQRAASGRPTETPTDKPTPCQEATDGAPKETISVHSERYIEGPTPGPD